MGNTIYKISATGTKAIFTSAVSGPFALAFDAHDNLFACNFRTGTIVRITPAKVVTGFANGLGGPVGLAFDRSGFLYVSCQSDGTVARYATNGAVSIFASGLARPTGLAFDAAGNLFVTERSAGRITKIAPNGTKAPFAGGLTEPFGAAVDGAGNLFVADHSLGAIFKYSPAGARTTFASNLHLPTFLTVEPATGSILNISTRAKVLSGDDVLIGGFVVSGTGFKRILLRGMGPLLTTAHVPGALADPTLELRSASALITMNDNWRDSQQATIMSTGLAPHDNRESAIVTTLAAGAYTVIERGKNNTTGIGLVEIYDLNPTATAKLSNISARASIGTGDNVAIAGFILGNGNGAKVLIRGRGPSLRQAGITNALADPMLELRDANGQLLAANDNWKSSQTIAIQATHIQPSNDLEPAIVTTLPSGPYTAIMRGKNNGVGIGLVEVYRVQ
jgi:sugar lactone lactonase YvrE